MKCIYTLGIGMWVALFSYTGYLLINLYFGGL